jgi:Na+-transporting methylmalonyl-CoA/oxaloacetate decarboxylase gamma subunit
MPGVDEFLFLFIVVVVVIGVGWFIYDARSDAEK